MQQLVNTVSEFNQSDRMLEVEYFDARIFASELFMPKLIGWVNTKYPNISLKLETIKSRAPMPLSTPTSLLCCQGNNKLLTIFMIYSPSPIYQHAIHNFTVI
ncbi:hypothetical protein PEC18_34705 [Paucibacter sp. O1-1]|nr:hypothetical protein [Paucibacter sp. O1-1]MDA3830832.1 hypothetical protein [Paucibacter sp. O1-1]